MKRASVIIGVNKTGGLPVLRDAAAGATRLAEWLTEEGYEATPLVDDEKPVLVNDVLAAVDRYVKAGIYDQLLIYFSGHGYLNDGSEHWLLSDAPANPNEAISLDENIQLARDCGIPNVIFISDACRSTPQSLKADRVRGSLVFPNDGVARNNRADIDRLFACLPGDPAFEVPVEQSSGQYVALFTTCLQNAYEDTPAAQTLKIGGIEVLPNRKLKKLLPGLVEATALKSSINLYQRPDIIVESEPEVFIAKVERSAPLIDFGLDAMMTDTDKIEPEKGFVVGPIGRPRRLPPTNVPAPEDLRESAERLLAASLSGGAPYLPAESRLTAAIDVAQQQSTADHFETECGFGIRGVRVVDAVGLGCTPEILTPGGKDAEALIRVSWPTGVEKHEFAGTVLVRLEDGAGVILAALCGYIGTVVIDYGGFDIRTNGVAQVSYAPSSNSWRWGEYRQQKTRIEDMRALVAGLARNGLFRIGKDQAEKLADKIRLYKGCDPTLGLYAAYAYNDAGLIERVASVAGFVEDDLGGTMLYDIALLLRKTEKHNFRALSPFCPLLSQGWPLIRVQRASMPGAVREAGEFRRASLWTTFEPQGADILFEAIRTGRLS